VWKNRFVRDEFTRTFAIYYDNDVEVFIAGRDAYYESGHAYNTTMRLSSFGKGYERAASLRWPGLERANSSVQWSRLHDSSAGKRLGSFDVARNVRLAFRERTAVFVDGRSIKTTIAMRLECGNGVSMRKEMGLLRRSDNRKLPPE